MYGKHLTEAIYRNPKSRKTAVLAEMAKDSVTGVVTIPAVIFFLGIIYYNGLA